MMTSLLFGGFRSLCSCWEGCRADSQWNCEHFPSFHFITSESWERSILTNKYLFARTETVFVFASVCSSSRHRERLKSDSCVAFDQENRHHHHRHTFQPDRLCVLLHQLPSNEQNHNQIMGNDRIEVKNNESLMQYYHLMVVAVKIWSTSGKTTSMEKRNHLNGKVV